ncbi:MAG: hypothetical protein RMJ28_05250 [Nitrososphaerota archaeon]|nr:hypothetical protein [Nitrososphaerota archaeon]
MSLFGVAASSEVVEEGAYIVYSYSVSIGERSVSGVIREEVLRDYGNGTIRLRIEVTFNDGVATLEKKATKRLFMVPRLAYLPEGQFTYRNENYSISISSDRVGATQVSVGGRSYLANIYSVSGQATSQFRDPTSEGVESLQLQFSGVITLINGSGVIYNTEGRTVGPRGGTAKFTLMLIDTNIDLSTIQTSWTPPSTLPAELDSMASLIISGGMDARAPTTASAQERPQSSESSDYYFKAVAIAAIGLAALAAVAVVPSRLRRHPAGEEGLERKPHYV